MSNSENESLSKLKYLPIFRNENVQDVVKDISEVFLDTLIESELVKSLSGINLIVNAWGLKNDFEKKAFVKNIYRFIHTIDSVSQEEKTFFLSRMQTSDDFKNNVGVHIIEITSSLDENKTRIIANLFALVVKEEIDYIYYLKLVDIIKNIFYYDLIELKNAVDVHGVIISSTPELPNLISIDVASIYNDAKNGRELKPYEHTHLTKEGQVIVLVGMKDI